MKNRDFKNFVEGEIYHVYNRGINKEKMFLDKQDHRAFLFRLGLAFDIDKEILNKQNQTMSPKSRIRITGFGQKDFRLHAFCLMPNHFHLLIEQNSDASISLLIQKVCTSFSMYINKKYKRVGHLFQGNFKSVEIKSNPQLMWTTAYIHMNPVKDGLVTKPEDYEWSSYNDYAKNRNLSITHKDFVIDLFEGRNNLIKQTLSFKTKENNDFLNPTNNVKVQP